MSEYTEHYNLKKPAQSENYNVDDANANNTIIDNTLYSKVDKKAGKDLSTNDFTDGYKKKIDSMQTLYRFKGTVESVDDLHMIENPNTGDVYKCKADSNDYIWNGQEWVNIGKNIDFDAVMEEIDNINKDMEQKVQIEDMSKTYKGTNITVPTVEGYGRINKLYGKTIEDINLFDGILIAGTFNDGVPNTSSATTRIRNNSYISVKGDTDYTISAKYKNVLQVMIMLYNSSKTLITTSNYYDTWKNMNFTFRTTSDTAYVMFVFRDSAGTTIVAPDIKDVKLQKGTVATAWSPYNYATVEVTSQSGEDKSINRCYIKNGLYEGDLLDYRKRKIIRANGAEEDIECSNKIVQYPDSTTVYNKDGAEIEVELTNNKAISGLNENINNIEQKQSQMGNYSTEEQVIGKWINGKRLYRKVIKSTLPVCTTNGTSAYANVEHNITNIEDVYVENAFVNVDGTRYTLPYIHDNNYKVDASKATSTVVQLRNGIANLSSKDCYIILNYTKTTD